MILILRNATTPFVEGAFLPSFRLANTPGALFVRNPFQEGQFHSEFDSTHENEGRIFPRGQKHTTQFKKPTLARSLLHRVEWDNLENSTIGS